MPRRYLTIEEAVSALNREKEVEVFLGGFNENGEKFIRWASFSKQEGKFKGALWEVVDEGGPEFFDVYSFSPKSGEWDVPRKEVVSVSLVKALSELGCSSSGSRKSWNGSA